MGLAVAGGSVEAKDKSFHASFAGIGTNKDDFSFTGTPGFYAPVAGKSTLGQYTALLAGEAQLDRNTCTPPGGGSGVELAFVGEVFVLSFTERGDQFFLNLSPGGQLACFDPATRVASGQFTFDVSGGTGRFAGATGTIVQTWKFIGVASLSSPPVRGFFGGLTGTFDGTIELAE